MLTEIDGQQEGLFGKKWVDSMKSGKRFESNFKSSVPKDIFCYRLKDGTANWNTSDKSDTSFQASNICDFILADGEYVVLAELKNHRGKSLPLSCIRPNQLEEMLKYDKFVFVKPMFIVNFEDLNECYALSVEWVKDFIELGQRKSISVSDMREWGTEVPCTKKKVNSVYDLSVLF